MRASTVISFVVALLLAGLAVVGVRGWMESERAAIVQSALQPETAPKNYVVVAKGSLGFGDRITADRVELLEWASDRIPEGAFTSVESLVGANDEDARYVLSSLESGEMILPGKITTPGQRAKLSTAITPGMRAVSISVNDVLGVAGFVLPGDRVDVMLTRNDGAGPFVDVLLQGVRVVAIDQTADDRADQPSVVRTVTFEVTTDEAQKLTLAANIGTLSLALRNIGAGEMEKTDRVSVIDLNDIDSSKRDQELAQAQAELAAAKAQGQTGAEALARVARLESELATLKVEAAKPAPAPEPAPVALAEVAPAPVAVAQPAEAVPDFRNVGVIRGGQRAEYRVLMFLNN